MQNVVLVQSGDIKFYVEAENAGGSETVSAGGAMTLDGVRDTVEAIANQMSEVWDNVKPDEATVEFGIKVIAKSGKLSGLLVEGGGEAALNIKLTWKSSN